MFKKSLLQVIVSLVLGTVLGLPVFAAGEVDPTFNAFLADTLGVVKESAIQPDGKIVIRGDFTTLDNKIRYYVARINLDGTIDESFNPDIGPAMEAPNSDPISRIELQSDGKILVSGRFSFQGVSRALIRLNPDGSPDTAFNNNPDVISFYNSVGALDVYPDNRIVFVAFTIGIGWRTLILNPQGSIIAQSTVETDKVYIQPDGKILRLRNGSLSRLNQDLSIDASFTGPTPNSGAYFDVDLQPDGKIIVGGSFTGINGENVHRVARLNANGTVDTTFNTADLANMSGNVYKVLVLQNGQVLVGGNFLQIGALQTYKIARLNPNGSIDASFKGESTYLLGNEVTDFDILPDGKIIIPIRSINKFNPDGSIDDSFHVLIAGKPSAGLDFDIQTDGKIIVVGQFTNVNGKLVDKIVRFNTDGTVDDSFILNFASNSCSPLAVKIQNNGKIIVGCTNKALRFNADGSFDLQFPNGFFGTEIIEQAPNGIIYLGYQYLLRSFTPEGVLLANQLSPNIPVLDVKTQSDSKVIFSYYAVNGLRRINADGVSVDGSFNPTINNAVYSIVVQPDGKILIGGDFTLVNSVSRFRIARLNADGTLDATFQPTFLTENVRNIAVQPDGKILVQTLTGSGSAAYSEILRLNPDGSKDNGFQTVSVNKSVNKLAVTDGGAKALIVGDFTRANGIPKLGIARINLAPAKTLFDYDGDGRADVSVFRPSDGAWYLLQSTAGFTGVTFGFGTDLITPADFDGDGKTDVAVFRPSDGAWYRLNSSNGAFEAYLFGQAGDIPLPGDFDGDGKADINVFRPSNGAWYRINSSNGQFVGTTFGQNGDKPLLADYDGDGKNDIAVFRPSDGAFYWLESSTGQFKAIAFGFGTDIPTPADFDGDGKTDIAVFRPSNGEWYRYNSSNGAFVSAVFGTNGDIPVAADYDGDGKANLAVFRPSANSWYIARPTGVPGQNFDAVVFGFGTDIPTPAAYR